MDTTRFNDEELARLEGLSEALMSEGFELLDIVPRIRALQGLLESLQAELIRTKISLSDLTMLGYNEINLRSRLGEKVLTPGGQGVVKGYRIEVMMTGVEQVTVKVNLVVEGLQGPSPGCYEMYSQDKVTHCMEYDLRDCKWPSSTK